MEETDTLIVCLLQVINTEIIDHNDRRGMKTKRWRTVMTRLTEGEGDGKGWEDGKGGEGYVEQWEVGNGLNRDFSQLT